MEEEESAVMNAHRPLLFLSQGDAPFETSHFTILRCPFATDQCTAVFPLESAILRREEDEEEHFLLYAFRRFMRIFL